MKSLEEEIEDLADLDSLRIRSGKLRDEGREALKGLRPDQWESAGDRIEDALVVKALCIRIAHEAPPRRLVRALESMTLQEVFASAANQERGDLTAGDEVPILRSARALQALVAAPDSALSKSALFFYYRIVRELYLADAPEWNTGGARAGDAGPATAFVTSECIRAIHGFARTLDHTATYVEGIAEMLQQGERLKQEEIPSEWRLAEAQRVQLAFSTSIEDLTRNIALRLKQRTSSKKFDLDSIFLYLKHAPADLVAAMDSALEAFELSEAEINEFRKMERRAARQDSLRHKRLQRSESGHLIALGAVEKAVSHARAARACFPPSDSLDSQSTLAALRKLQLLFREAAHEVRKLLYPAKGFISAVLDRELAEAAFDDRLGWDPGEMAFAAASYGAITSSWDEERLVRAVRYLSKALSERGRFPVGRPIHSRRQGYKLHVFGGEILRAFAQLLQKVHSVPLDPALVRRMLVFFQDTGTSPSGHPEMSAWYHEGPQQPLRPDRSVTAVAVLALDRINRMLDERINERVFRHFSVKRPETLRRGPDLRNLFYPDYGLRLVRDKRICRSESVAIHLERMRAHVAGVRPPRKEWDPLYSMVLHGPPGTGKTTLVEALAASCGVPLVEITPSDIVYGGEEAVERRARAVFHALSLLTRVVIIFDEFDPVLRRRNPDDPGPRTVFSFLTPGMLPKLKTLNKSAGRRSVAYVLITNLIGTLDEAAIRSGRFDCRLGIYPPDLLSRTGRFLSELMEFCRRCSKALPDGCRERVGEVVRNTAGGGMQSLGVRGWYVSPKDWDSLRKGTPFHFVLHTNSAQPVWSEPEARITRVQGSGAAAEQEYLQWDWVCQWDKALTGRKLDEALKVFPVKAAELKWPAGVSAGTGQKVEVPAGEAAE